MAVLAAVGVGRGPACPSTCAGAATPADTATMGRWETRAPAPSARSEVAGAAVGDRIYVAGGLTPIGVAADGQEYDPATDRWTARAPLPQAIHHPAAAGLGGRLYVVGGFVVQGLSLWHAVNTVYEYDPG